MSQPQEIPWKRILVEAAAIVASILLAFAIDAWWQDRKEDIVEVQYLRALREDLLRSLELLDESEAKQRRQVSYLESLLLTDADSPYSDELRRWLDEGLFVVGSYAPQLSALAELESSGQVQIIGNKSLRRALATTRQRIDRMEARQRDFQQSQQMLMDPFLVDNFNLSALLPDRITAHEPDLSMLGTSDFQSRVAFKISLRSWVSRSQDEVRAAFTEALQLIEAELHAKDGA